VYALIQNMIKLSLPLSEYIKILFYVIVVQNFANCILLNVECILIFPIFTRQHASYDVFMCSVCLCYSPRHDVQRFRYVYSVKWF